MTGNYYPKAIWLEIYVDPHVMSRTLKIKPHVHTIKFIKIDLNLLKMTQYDDSYYVQSNVARPTCRTHVKSGATKFLHI